MFHATTGGLLRHTCHTIDVGGVGFSAEARSVYEEGTCIPHLRAGRRGQLNDDLMAVIQANSRNPVEARGDILSLVSANEVGAARLVEMMAEFDLADLDAWQRTSSSTRAAPRSRRSPALPRGRWRARMQLDGYEAPVMLVADARAPDERHRRRLRRLGPASGAASTRPKCYTDAYSVFGLKCLIAPEVPNNAGSLAPLRSARRPGSVVHPLRPAPVTARHVVGQMLPDLMFGCLEQALQGQVPAEGASCNWTVQLRRGPDQARADAPAFDAVFFNTGGTGARPQLDGLSAVAFPSGVKSLPVEVVEHGAPIVVWRKELRAELRRCRHPARRPRRHCRGRHPP